MEFAACDWKYTPAERRHLRAWVAIRVLGFEFWVPHPCALGNGGLILDPGSRFPLIELVRNWPEGVEQSEQPPPFQKREGWGTRKNQTHHAMKADRSDIIPS